MAPTLERVDADIEVKELASLMERDGAVVVKDALREEQLVSLNTDVEEVMTATAPGLRHPTSDVYVEFYGSSTIRLDGLPAPVQDIPGGDAV